ELGIGGWELTPLTESAHGCDELQSCSVERGFALQSCAAMRTVSRSHHREGVMKRTYVLGMIVIAGAVVAAAANLTAQQPAQGQGREGRGGAGGGGRGPGFPPVSAIEKVGNNLYLIQGQGGNTAVYIAAKGVVLVDTKLANNGQAILDQ